MLAATKLAMQSACGGWWSDSCKWHPGWCFVTLVIFGVSALLLIGWTMPETGRSVVGNGAVEAWGIWATWWQLIRSTLIHKGQEAQEDPNFGQTGCGNLSMPNPFPSYCIQTFIPLIYGRDYGFNDLEVGLSFLAGGGGVIVRGVIAGRLMDWNFKKAAVKAGFPPDKRKGIDIDSFPIKEARTTTSIPIMLVSMFAVGGYGWAVHAQAHPTIPLILQFYVDAKCTVLHQIYSALIVDISPSSPGTARASNKICRCTLSAVLVAILQPTVKAIGYS
ncbi:hypothetical protein GGR55DRAFT_681662 [Xylaria sp. FL0064]|nr:hypothetical protein GGR55DRAFT_681662 [Xylaria sp. FL0064]